jgi:hypothetical protein
MLTEAVTAVLVITLILYFFYKRVIKKDGLMIYTQNNITGPLESIDMTETFTYPDCTATGSIEQCVMENNYIYQGYQYNTDDQRCFKSKSDQDVNRLESAYNKLYDMTQINTYFESCLNGLNMYLPVTGRYVRIQRPMGDINPISIKTFDIFASNLLSGVDELAVPIDIHKQPTINLTDLTTGPGTSVNPAYIQTDLGSNKIIKSIILNKITNMDGCVLYIVKDNGTNLGNVVYQTVLNNVD